MMHLRLIYTVNCINFCWSISPSKSLVSWDSSAWQELASGTSILFVFEVEPGSCSGSLNDQSSHTPSDVCQAPLAPCTFLSPHCPDHRQSQLLPNQKIKHPLPHVWGIASGFERMKIYRDREFIFVSNENQTFLKRQHLHAEKRRIGKARNEFCWYLREKFIRPLLPVIWHTSTVWQERAVIVFVFIQDKSSHGVRNFPNT